MTLKLKIFICSTICALLFHFCKCKLIDDMELSDEQYDTYLSDGEMMSFGRDGTSYIWPNAEIPVAFDEATIPVGSFGRLLVEGTMTEMNKGLCGCFRFRLAKSSDFDRVLVQSDPRKENVCSSYVGKQNGTQTLQLGKNCFQKGVVQHELLHSSGIYHEQSRPDRDDFVQVHEGCILNDRQINFRTRKTSNTYGLAYNPKSIMHYDSKAFSRTGCKTITSKIDGVTDDQLGSAKEMSKLDYEKLVKHYHCPTNWHLRCPSVCDSDVDCQWGESCDYGICAPNKASGQVEQNFKINSTTFLNMLKENPICNSANPDGKSTTYYALAMNCAWRNGGEVIKSCREEVMGCLMLNGDAVERSVLEVLEESSPMEKENYKRANQVSFTSLELNTDMQKRIKECTTKYGVKEQWFWSPDPQKPNACQNYVDATNLPTDLKDGCYPTWYSLPWRSKFYMECLKEFDLGGMIQRGKVAIQRIEDIGHVLRDEEHKLSQTKIGAGAAQVTGPLLYGLGIALAPFTGGASLVLKAVGTGIAISGAVTSVVTSFRDNNPQWVRKARNEETYLRGEVEDLEALFALYLTAIYEEDNFDYVGMNAMGYDYFKQQALHKMRAQFQLGNAAMMTIDTLFDKLIREKFGSLIKSTYSTSKVDKVGTLSQTVKQKGISIIDGYKGKNPADLTTFGRRIKGTTFAKLKLGAKIGAKAMVVLGQFASIGFGIWEIVDGAESLKSAGISSQILLKAKQLDHRMNSLISDYDDIVGLDTIIKQDAQSRTELLYGIDVYGTESVWIKVKIQSENATCTTNSIKTYSSGAYYSAGHTRITTEELLGQCYRMPIKGDRASIKIRNIYGSSLVVNRVDISTNGKIVPSIMCNETEPIKLDVIDISKTSLSCQFRKSLHRIKIHTSNEDWAGTDATVLLDLRIRETRTDKLLEECEGLLIDNYGNDHERGAIDFYFSGDYAKCTDPIGNIAEGTYDSKDYELEVRVAVDDRSYRYAASAWKVDLIKFYFMGIGDKDKVIYCHPGNGNGAWVHSEHTFKCALKHSQNDQRALEAIKVKTCDVSTAGTDSATIQFTFCNQEFKQGDLECAFDNDCGLLGHNDTKLNVLDKCCRTNKFGWYNSKRSLWQGETLKFDGNTNDDDGGDKLGPCEGFEITGSKVFSYVNNYSGDRWCVNHLWFYAEPKLSLRNGLIGECKIRDTWADDKAVWRFDEWKEVYHKSSKINDCDLGDTNGLSSVSYKVCNEGSDTGSTSLFYATIENGNSERCVMPLRPSNETYLQNEFVHVDEIVGDCKNLKLAGEISIWIHNDPNAIETDDLCLTHFYMKGYNSRDKKFVDAGHKNDDIRKKSYQCTFNQDAQFAVYFQGKETNGIPLRCK